MTRVRLCVCFALFAATAACGTSSGADAAPGSADAAHGAADAAPGAPDAAKPAGCSVSLTGDLTITNTPCTLKVGYDPMQDQASFVFTVTAPTGDMIAPGIRIKGAPMVKTYTAGGTDSKGIGGIVSTASAAYAASDGKAGGGAMASGTVHDVVITSSTMTGTTMGVDFYDVHGTFSAHMPQIVPVTTGALDMSVTF